MAEGLVDPSQLATEAAPVRNWLRRYFSRRVRERFDIDDLVQDVFARIVARDSTEPVGNLGGYVYKTAASVLADRVRSRESREAGHHVSFDAELHGEESIDPERILGARQELQAAIAVLLSLPERTRTVFILRRFEGQRFQQIADQLGITVSAVEKHMVRAIHQLSLEMEKLHGP